MQAIAQLRQWWTKREEVRFKRNAIGWVLVILNALAALNAAFFFLGMLKASVADWLMLNTCTPSIALFVIGFLLGSPVVMVAASVPMSYYGTGGLFVFGWSGYDIPAQIGHILMTLGVINTMVWIVRHKQWRTLVLGVALGVAILIPLMAIQMRWFSAHPEMVEMLFSGDWVLPGQ